MLRDTSDGAAASARGAPTRNARKKRPAYQPCDPVGGVSRPSDDVEAWAYRDHRPARTSARTSIPALVTRSSQVSSIFHIPAYFQESLTP